MISLQIFKFFDAILVTFNQWWQMGNLHIRKPVFQICTLSLVCAGRMKSITILGDMNWNVFFWDIEITVAIEL